MRPPRRAISLLLATHAPLLATPHSAARHHSRLAAGRSATVSADRNERVAESRCCNCARHIGDPRECAARYRRRERRLASRTSDARRAGDRGGVCGQWSVHCARWDGDTRPSGRRAHVRSTLSAPARRSRRSGSARRAHHSWCDANRGVGASMARACPRCGRHGSGAKRRHVSHRLAARGRRALAHRSQSGVLDSGAEERSHSRCNARS
jgi:hypothetical protein